MLLRLFAGILFSCSLVQAQPTNIVQNLYDASAQTDYTLADKIVGQHYPAFGGKATLYEKARDLAKQKKDCESTQYFTQKIIDSQKGFIEQHPKMILSFTVVFMVLMGATTSYLAYKEGYEMGQHDSL